MDLHARSRCENLFRAVETIGRIVVLPEAGTLITYQPEEATQEVMDVATVTV